MIVEACNLARGSNVAGLKEEGGEKKSSLFLFNSSALASHTAAGNLRCG